MLFLSSFSKYFFGGFEGFQGVMGREFAFLLFFDSSKFFSPGKPKNRTRDSPLRRREERRPALADRTSTLAQILISGKSIRVRQGIFCRGLRGADPAARHGLCIGASLGGC